MRTRPGPEKTFPLRGNPLLQRERSAFPAPRSRGPEARNSLLLSCYWQQRAQLFRRVPTILSTRGSESPPASAHVPWARDAFSLQTLCSSERWKKRWRRWQRLNHVSSCTSQADTLRPPPGLVADCVRCPGRLWQEPGTAARSTPRNTLNVYVLMNPGQTKGSCWRQPYFAGLLDVVRANVSSTPSAALPLSPPLPLLPSGLAAARQKARTRD